MRDISEVMNGMGSIGEAQKALRMARNIVKREQGYKTTLPDGSKIPSEIINEQIQVDMMSDYTDLYHKFVPSSGQVHMQPEGRQRGKAQTTEEGKKKVSEATVEFIKEQTRAKEGLLDLPTPEEFYKLKPEEQAVYYNQIKSYEKNYDYTAPTARKWKADAEVIRSRFLNSSKIPLEIRRLLAKSDLQTTMDYLKFMDKAKNNIGIAFDDSNQAMDKFYSQEYADLPNFVKTDEQKILFNFLRDQISRHDGDYKDKLIRKAASIKVRGKHVFSYSDLEGYL